jgi:hypothetical protein
MKIEKKASMANVASQPAASRNKYGVSMAWRS